MPDKSERDEGIRHFQRGVAFERANRFLEAVKEYRQAVDRYPQLREAHAALGFHYQRHGLLAKAAEEFYLVARLEEDFLSYFNLGHILIEIGRYEEALHALSHCLNEEPDDAATHYEIAYIHFCQGALDLALSHLQVPLQSYPEDWEIHHLIGKCYLGLKNYPEALRAFRQALMLATTPHAEAETLNNIMTIERSREFSEVRSKKDLVYMQQGVVYLGSSQDDGVIVSESPHYHFTYPDIGTTLQRLVALAQALRWPFTAVVPIDKLAQPLANAIGRVLGSAVCQTSDLTAEDTALLVMSVAREVELLLLTIEHVPCHAVTFCLGLNWQRRCALLPDVIGMIAHETCSVPWESGIGRLRADGSAPASIDQALQQATAQILQAFAETPPDANRAQQIDYYAHDHRNLSFWPPPGEENRRGDGPVEEPQALLPANGRGG
ncbi:MAG: tetratricopeptide repeat protein [Chloroflexaceae bacterium]|nr:tetratricopeptide repeat protein [Chloroflexaceae bacterium]